MEQKQNINVTLEVKEIIYDIMNKTHLTGHAREAEGKKNFEAASYMQASEDEEASYQIRREVSNAFAAIKVRLGEYLDEDTTTTNNRVNAEVDGGGQLKLAFEMPSNFHNAAVDSLGQGCHQYVVNKSIAAWFVITNPEEAATYEGLAEQALETARRALYKRARPVRPTYTSDTSDTSGSSSSGPRPPRREPIKGDESTPPPADEQEAPPSDDEDSE